MVRTSRRPLRPLRALQFAILTSTALLVAGVSIVTGAPRLFAARSPVGQLLGHHQPDVVFRLAGEELLANRGQLSEATKASVRAAARRAPLAAEPFFFEGIQALIAGEAARGERLLVEARARHPRHRLTRLALLALYLETRRVRAATQEIVVVTRIIPRADEVLVPRLAQLASAPATREAVVAAIGSEPLMDSVLNYLAARRTDPDLLERLAARLPASRPGGSPPWQDAIISALVERGEVARAYSMWRRFSGLGEGKPPLIYDAEFAGRPGAAPFNWVFASSNIGAVERVPGSALSVEFFGRVSGPLATQMLMLSPARYRLTFQVEGDAPDGQLVWQVQCQEGQELLLEIPLAEVTYAPKQFSGEFTVPGASCSAQWLRLEGNAREFPVPQSVSISELALTRVSD